MLSVKALPKCDGVLDVCGSFPNFLAISALKLQIVKGASAS